MIRVTQFNVDTIYGTPLAAGLMEMTAVCGTKSSGQPQVVGPNRKPFDWFPSSTDIDDDTESAGMTDIDDDTESAGMTDIDDTVSAGMLEMQLETVHEIKKICIIVYYEPPGLTDAAIDIFIKSGTILQSSIGHCYLSWDSDIGVCGLWDVCLHKQYLGIKGWGSILLKNILFNIIMYFPSRSDIIVGKFTPLTPNTSVIIWLCVDLNNVNFVNVVGLYTKYGFKDPMLVTKDPFGNDWGKSFPNKLMSLSRKNEYILPSDIDKPSVLNDIIYLLQQSVRLFNVKQTDGMVPFLSSTDPIKAYPGTSCSAIYVFDNENVDLMNTFPHSSTSMNKNGSITQKEVSGQFVVISTDQDETTLSTKRIIWTVGIDTKSIAYGEEDTVDVRDVEYVFHTHPKSYYEMEHLIPYYMLIKDQKVMQSTGVSSPSAADYLNILAHSTSKMKWHAVLTVPGIYIIHVNKEWFKTEKGDIIPTNIVELQQNLNEVIHTEAKEKMRVAVNTEYQALQPASKERIWAEELSILYTYLDNDTVNEKLYNFRSDDKKREYLLNNIQAENPSWTEAELEAELKIRIAQSPPPLPKTTWEDLITLLLHTYWGMTWDFPGDGDNIIPSCKLYAELITNMRILGGRSPLFNVNFMTWEEAREGAEFVVDFQEYKENCFTTTDIEDTYKSLYESSD